MGNSAQAALILEKAKCIEPSKGSIRELLGRAYYNYGQFRKAANEFLEALKIDPTNHYAHYGLSLCYLKIKNITNAKKHMKIANAMMPDEERYQKVLNIILALND